MFHLQVEAAEFLLRVLLAQSGCQNSFRTLHQRRMGPAPENRQLRPRLAAHDQFVSVPEFEKTAVPKLFCQGSFSGRAKQPYFSPLQLKYRSPSLEPSLLPGTAAMELGHER